MRHQDPKPQEAPSSGAPNLGVPQTAPQQLLYRSRCWLSGKLRLLFVSLRKFFVCLLNQDLIKFVSDNSTDLVFIWLFLLLYIIFFFSIFHNGTTTNSPTSPGIVYKYEFETCVSDLSKFFPNQEPILWKQFSNQIKYNMLKSKTVLCQTIITHKSNANAVNCLLKKISKCLDTIPIIFPEAAKSFTPDQLIDRISSSLDLNKFVIFNNISDFPYPLPVLFHSICDPDYTPYPQSYFYFTFLTSDPITNKPSMPQMAKIVEMALLRAWSNPEYKSEEAIASIVRITPVIYYVRNEEEDPCLPN